MDAAVSPLRGWPSGSAPPSPPNAASPPTLASQAPLYKHPIQHQTSLVGFGLAACLATGLGASYVYRQAAAAPSSQTLWLLLCLLNASYAGLSTYAHYARLPWYQRRWVAVDFVFLYVSMLALVALYYLRPLGSVPDAFYVALVHANCGSVFGHPLIATLLGNTLLIPVYIALDYKSRIERVGLWQWLPRGLAMLLMLNVSIFAVKMVIGFERWEEQQGMWTYLERRRRRWYEHQHRRRQQQLLINRQQLQQQHLQQQLHLQQQQQQRLSATSQQTPALSPGTGVRLQLASSTRSGSPPQSLSPAVSAPLPQPATRPTSGGPPQAAQPLLRPRSGSTPQIQSPWLSAGQEAARLSSQGQVPSPPSIQGQGLARSPALRQPLLSSQYSGDALPRPLTRLEWLWECMTGSVMEALCLYMYLHEQAPRVQRWIFADLSRSVTLFCAGVITYQTAALCVKEAFYGKRPDDRGHNSVEVIVKPSFLVIGIVASWVLGYLGRPVL